MNNWARGRAGVPRWAGLLAVALEKFTLEGLDIMFEEAAFRWHEILGVSPEADAIAARRAMTRLALLYHPDKRGPVKAPRAWPNSRVSSNSAEWRHS